MRDARPSDGQHLAHSGKEAYEDLSPSSSLTEHRRPTPLAHPIGTLNAGAIQSPIGSEKEHREANPILDIEQTQDMDGVSGDYSDLASTVLFPITTQKQGYILLLQYGFSVILSALSWSLDHLYWRYGLEKEVPKDCVRIRWTYKCGGRFFDDFIENRYGAARELEQHLNRPRARPPGGSGSDSSNSNSLSKSSLRSSQHTSWTSQDISDMSLSILNNSDNRTNNQQLYNPIRSANANARIPVLREEQWLLACANERRFTAKVAHLDMDPTRI
ncbi:MAG: hypothetical protein M1839_001057 [Geoglossum umbratile]|nr:MAG: hypothetical protein M1839_001057 [Geoglossum umbratile]